MGRKTLIIKEKILIRKTDTKYFVGNFFIVHLIF